VGKRKDGFFHLSISFVALGLAVISGGSLIYQQNPERFHRLLSGVIHSVSLAKFSVANSKGTPSLKKANLVADDIQDMKPYVEKNNASMVKVVSVAQDAKTLDVPTVRELLNKYEVIHQDSRALALNFTDPVTIYVAHTAKEYGQVLRKLGVDNTQLKQLTMDTGGFTQGNHVAIPMYQNTDKGDLINTLAHELTHVFLNQNTGSIPSWMNEGLAVSDGMNAQDRMEGPVVFGGYARQMAETVLAATTAGSLLPLEADENKILKGNTPYDLELQDWIAVSKLRQQYPFQDMVNYLFRMNIGEDSDVAFQRSFGQTESTFNQTMTQLFHNAALTQDRGVRIGLKIPQSFQGSLRILQHGTQTWQGITAKPGTAWVDVQSDGKITSSAPRLKPAFDSTPGDEDTLYINLNPKGEASTNEIPIQDAGFAIDYHNGLYSFVNTWVTPTNGNSTYGSIPTIFGVQLTQIQELNPNNPLLALLQ
jgi:hypothetical protein